jgi:hypothetical protein
MSKKLSPAPLWAAVACSLLSACGGGSVSDSQHHSPGAAQVLPPSNSPEPIPEPSGGNHTLVIIGTPPEATTVDSAWSFQPSANGPDADSLQFTVANAPSWMEFDPGTGQLGGTPGEGDIGIYDDIVISVTDGLETVSLAPFSVEVLPNGAAAGNAILSWEPPTERVNGSPVGELAGYRVLYGRGIRKYDHDVVIDNPGITRYVVEDLAPGNWFFAVTARTTDGLESAPSAEVRKRIPQSSKGGS